VRRLFRGEVGGHSRVCIRLPAINSLGRERKSVWYESKNKGAWEMFFSGLEMTNAGSMTANSLKFQRMAQYMAEFLTI
jgi:hypothetical protein